jgi:hypothetical protein
MVNFAHRLAEKPVGYVDFKPEHGRLTQVCAATGLSRAEFARRFALDPRAF